jgi:predicted signal transduction protein with EAL and GGDEF domain
LDLSIHSSRWPVRLSLGAATWPADGASVETLLEQADMAMYQDKGSRKSRAEMHVASNRSRAEPTLSWGGPEIAKTG